MQLAQVRGGVARLWIGQWQIFNGGAKEGSVYTPVYWEVYVAFFWLMFVVW